MDRTIAHNPPPLEPPNNRLEEDVHGANGSSTNNRAADRPSDEQREQVIQQLRQLAWFLDDSIPIPGLGMRIGADGLLGLIPGVGDLISAGISSFIIRKAAVLGAPKLILLRMAFNTTIDFVIGMVPLVGDLFDFAWKANRRNVQLLIDYVENPRKAHRASWLSVVGMASAIGVAVGLLVLIVGGLIASLM